MYQNPWRKMRYRSSPRWGEHLLLSLISKIRERLWGQVSEGRGEQAACRMLTFLGRANIEKPWMMGCRVGLVLEFPLTTGGCSRGKKPMYHQRYLGNLVNEHWDFCGGEEV